jgi:hypothetical protein
MWSLGSILTKGIVFQGEDLHTRGTSCRRSLKVYGIGAGLNAVTRAEKIIRVAVSIIFIGVGIYLVVLWIQA